VELVAAIAKRTGLSKKAVRAALFGLIEEVSETTKMGEHVVLTGFGTFHPYETKARPLFGGKQTVRPQQRIRFKQSRRSLEMEKLNVVLDDEKTKTASETKHCPKCGTKLDEENPMKCPKCGTEPFEKRPQGDGR
jgi:nucleoid DNA-binding protein